MGEVEMKREVGEVGEVEREEIKPMKDVIVEE